MREYLERYQLPLTVAGLLLLFLAWQFRYVLLTLFGSYLLAAAFSVPVAWLTKQGLPRWLSIFLTYLVTLTLLIGGLVYAAFPLTEEVGRFLETFPRYAGNAAALFATLPLDIPELQSLLSRLNELAVTATSGTVAAITGIVIALVSSIYLLSDWKRVHETLSRLFPKDDQEKARAFFSRVESRLGAWVRGQLILSLAVGAATFVGLLLLDMPFPAVLAILTAILELVPFVGPILAAIPAILIALTISDTQVLLVIGLYVLIQQLESHILVPLVMRRAVKLHPVVIIFGLIVGYQAAGLAGVLFSVPLISVAWIAWGMLNGRTKQH